MTALLGRGAAAWVLCVHRHTSNSRRPLGCTVLAGRVAELLPDVLRSAAVISTAPSSIVHSVQVTQRTAEAVACGRPFLTHLPHAHQLLCAAAHLASKLCAATLPQYSVLCRTTSQMPSGACCSPRRGWLPSPRQVEVCADCLVAQLPSSTPGTCQSRKSCAWWWCLALLKLILSVPAGSSLCFPLLRADLPCLPA